MKIEKLELCNFRGINLLEFNFHDKLNLFVGVNGSGKSSVLDAMSLILSCLVSRIKGDSSNGIQIAEGDIRNGSEKGHIKIFPHYKSARYHYILSKSVKGSMTKSSYYNGSYKMIEEILKNYQNNSTLPVIVYYPVNRSVQGIKPDISNSTVFSMFDIYGAFLGGESNFHRFFEWFRHQDDVLNEQAYSRDIWVKKNEKWIEQNINSILVNLKALISQEDKLKDVPYKEYNTRHNLSTLLTYMWDTIYEFTLQHSRQYESLYSIQDIELMYYKLWSLSIEDRSNLIENNGYFLDSVRKIMKTIHRSFNQLPKEHLMQTVTFIWEVFSFVILSGLWWIENGRRSKIETLLRELIESKFIDPHIHIEDTCAKEISKIIQEELDQIKRSQQDKRRELQYVRNAIQAFIPEYEILQVKRIPRPRMELTKNGEILDLNQLSDGEKNLIALIGDIARHLTMANPNMDNPLNGEGIILIDEIDLHLHPKWQSTVVPKLQEIFPHCQFFISTHSPQVISNIKPESIFVLENINNTIQLTTPDESYGMSIDRVVELIMDDFARAEKPRKELNMLFEFIERNNINEAKNLLSQMKANMKTDPDILHAEALIRVSEREK